ncbi:MAG: ABC transporter ATP-binding protein/permease [Deltaproteobacteria bacterium]|nr:ABC transporter ATP-binding protein/permease [Deltaproteobacteria bacterium]
MGGLKLITPYFRRHLPWVAMGFVALMGCDLAQLIIPGLLGRGIDLMSAPGAAPGDLWPIVRLIGVMALIIAGLRFVWRNHILGFARLVERGLRDRLYAKLIRLSPRWHLENSSGDLMAMATNDMDNIRLALATGLISIVDTVFLGCAALFFMVSISPGLTLWAILPLPAITIVTHLLGRRLYILVLATQNSFGLLTETVREKMAGLKVIRAMGLGALALEETERSGRDYMKINIRQALLAGTFFPFLYLMSNLALALVLYFGGRETISGRVSTGDFVAFISYLALLTWPLIALGMVVGILQQGLASLARLDRVFSAENEETPAILPPDENRTEIVIEHLTFQYPTRREPALANVSLTLAHDRITALVGPMGGGKSTLAALLPALFAAPPGTIMVAGRPLEDWPLPALRARFGYVPQDGFLWNGTIYENVAFGRPSAGEAEVLAAAEAAGLGEDLNFFPDGLETLVGERGLTLSGGQKQRLALARALLIDPPYLIMDDPLSAVDAEVEARIMDRLLALRRGRGGLIISHRLSSLMGADWVVVLERGRVTDQGAPAELMSRDGYFKRVRELGEDFI